MPVFFQPKGKSPEEITEFDASEVIRAIAENDVKLATDGVADDVTGTVYLVPKSPPIVDGNGNVSQRGGTTS